MTEAAFYSREEPNLSVAWARAFLGLIDHPRGEYVPFLVSIAGLNGADPEGDADLRDALDACLEANGHDRVQTVANTIFPQSLWRRAKGNRKAFFRSYLEDLPSFVEMDRRNQRGIYFARLIGFGLNPKDALCLPHAPTKAISEDGNQLEFIIEECKRGGRRTKLQAALFDPYRDLTRSAQQGFPCLQHLTFVPDRDRHTLGLNTFYATQQLFVKAYGNWLGLCRLGAFVAHEAGLRFDRLTCFAGIQKMDGDKRPRPGDSLDRLRDLADAVVRAAGVANAEPALATE
jgi:hypothetical protein